MIKAVKRLRKLINHYKLVFGVGAAIVICLLLTVFSVLLYAITGTSKLDLSRPGYEDVRRKVAKVQPGEGSFEPSGPLDGKIIDDYLKKYQKQSQNLSKYDSFDPKLLDDAALGLSSVQTGPSDGTNP